MIYIYNLLFLLLIVKIVGQSSNSPITLISTSQYISVPPHFYFQFSLSSGDIGLQYQTINQVNGIIQLVPDLSQNKVQTSYNLLFLPSSNPITQSQYNLYRTAHALHSTCTFPNNYTSWDGNCLSCSIIALESGEPYACLNCTNLDNLNLTINSINKRNSPPLFGKSLLIIIDNTNIVWYTPNRTSISMLVGYILTMYVGQNIAEWAFLFCIVFLIILVVLILTAIYVSFRICKEEAQINENLKKNE